MNQTVAMTLMMICKLVEQSGTLLFSPPVQLLLLDPFVFLCTPEAPQGAFSAPHSHIITISHLLPLITTNSYLATTTLAQPRTYLCPGSLHNRSTRTTTATQPHNHTSPTTSAARTTSPARTRTDPPAILPYGPTKTPTNTLPTTPAAPPKLAHATTPYAHDTLPPHPRGATRTPPPPQGTTTPARPHRTLPTRRARRPSARRGLPAPTAPAPHQHAGEPPARPRASAPMTTRGHPITQPATRRQQPSHPTYAATRATCGTIKCRSSCTTQHPPTPKSPRLATVPPHGGGVARGIAAPLFW